MKHRWTTLLWELFAAQLLCTAAAMLPGSRVCTMPGLALPALGLAAAVPTAWIVWGVWAEPPLPLPPEQLLEPPRTLDPATLLDLPEPVAQKNKNPYTARSGPEVLFANRTALKRPC